VSGGSWKQVDLELALAAYHRLAPFGHVGDLDLVGPVPVEVVGARRGLGRRTGALVRRPLPELSLYPTSKGSNSRRPERPERQLDERLKTAA
jgi:hypothetical protein